MGSGTEILQVTARLSASREALVSAALGRLASTPVEPQGAVGHDELCRSNIASHLDALAAALQGGGAEQFGEHCAWSAVFFEGLAIPRSTVADSLAALSEVLDEHLGPALAAPARELIEAGQRRLGGSPLVTPVDLGRIPAATAAPSASAAEALERAAPRIAALTTALGFLRRPEDAFAHGARRARCREDILLHLAQLVAAVDIQDPWTFGEYAIWVQTLLTQLGLKPVELVNHLSALHDVLGIVLPAPFAEAPRRCVAAGLARLESAGDTPSFIDPQAYLGPLARDYHEALRAGDRYLASRLILDAVEEGTPIADIYNHVFQPCQYEMGRLWEYNRISIAEEHFYTAATQMIMSQLYPRIFNSAAKRVNRRLVAACVDGNLHEVGVRFVADFFEMAGWDTFYLGASTPPEHVLREVVHWKADVLAVSATLVSHVAAARTLIAVARAEAMLKDLCILVGGYPFRIVHDLWRRIGADGSASNAAEAVRVAERFLEARDA